jgi:hypothetical protein
LIFQIYTFVNLVVSSFFEAAESNKFLFAGVLFWKTKHECVLMSSNGADDYEYDEEYERERGERGKGRGGGGERE